MKKKKENEFQKDSFVNDEHLILCFVFLNYCFVFFSILKRSDMYKILNLKKLHSDIYDSYFSKKKKKYISFNIHLRTISISIDIELHRAKQKAKFGQHHGGCSASKSAQYHPKDPSKSLLFTSAHTPFALHSALSVFVLTRRGDMLFATHSLSKINNLWIFGNLLCHRRRSEGPC